MQNFIEQPCVKALLNYQQADEDGIMVLTSRQAIHETVELLKALKAHMIQEFEKIYPREEKMSDEFAQGFNECRSIVVEKLNNLKK